MSDLLSSAKSPVPTSCHPFALSVPINLAPPASCPFVHLISSSLGDKGLSTIITNIRNIQNHPPASHPLSYQVPVIGFPIILDILNDWRCSEVYPITRNPHIFASHPPPAFISIVHLSGAFTMSSKRLGVFFIHRMGSPDEGFSNGLERRIKSALGQAGDQVAFK